MSLTLSDTRVYEPQTRAEISGAGEVQVELVKITALKSAVVEMAPFEICAIKRLNGRVEISGVGGGTG